MSKRRRKYHATFPPKSHRAAPSSRRRTGVAPNPELTFKPLLTRLFSICFFHDEKRQREIQAGLTFGQSAGPNFGKG